MVRGLLEELKTARTLRKLEGQPQVGWKTLLGALIVLAVFGGVANWLVWATIEGFGR